MTDPPHGDLTLVVKRVIPAPRERVFDAWTTPALIREWFHPDKGFTVEVAEVDLRVGGAFKIGLRAPNNELRIANGIYREIRRPERLVFTWVWEHVDAETLITLTFHDLGGSTEVVLKHSQLPDADLIAKHEHGWTGCLATMERIFE